MEKEGKFKMSKKQKKKDNVPGTIFDWASGINFFMTLTRSQSNQYLWLILNSSLLSFDLIYLRVISSILTDAKKQVEIFYLSWVRTIVN